MWDRTLTSYPSVHIEEVPDELIDALKTLRDVQNADPDWTLDKIKLVRQLVDPKLKRPDGAYLVAATRTVSSDWTVEEIACDLIAVARSIAPEDAERQTPKWGARFSGLAKGKVARADPGSRHFDLDQAPRVAPKTDPRRALLDYYDGQLNAANDRQVEERKILYRRIEQMEDRNDREMAAIRERHDQRISEMLERHETALARERERCDAEIASKTELLTKQTREVVDMMQDAMRTMHLAAQEVGAQLGAQNSDLHDRLHALGTTLTGMAEKVLDPSQSATLQAVSIMATGAGMVKTAFEAKHEIIEQRAEAAESQRRHDFMSNALGEAGKLGRLFLKAKYGIDLSATEGDDKDPDRFQKSVAKLVGEAAEGDWDVATEVVGAEAVAQLQALPAGWDSEKADDILADMIGKFAGREELMARLTETTRKNLMGVLDSVG